MRTYQDIFTTVYNHLIKQGVRAVDKGDACVYRAENGMKCAIGCLITDAAYDMEIEARDLEDITPVLTKSRIPTSVRSMKFLNGLQAAHDYSLRRGIPKFKQAMRQIAVDYKLELP